jgi:hypothetical protein
LQHDITRAIALEPLAIGALGLAFLLLMVWSDALRAGTGLYERLSSGVLSLWVFVFAARLCRVRTGDGCRTFSIACTGPPHK